MSLNLNAISYPPVYEGDHQQESIINHLSESTEQKTNPGSFPIAIQIVQQNSYMQVTQPEQMLNNFVVQNLQEDMPRIKSNSELEADKLMLEVALTSHHTSLYSLYLKLLKARDLYEQLSPDRVSKIALIKTYRNILILGEKIRAKKRKYEGHFSTFCIGTILPCFFVYAIPAAIYYGCKFKRSEWVTKNSMSAYFEKALTLCNDFLAEILKENKIQEGTSKDHLLNSVKKDLGFVYAELGNLYTCHEEINRDEFGTCCCCCYDDEDTDSPYHLRDNYKAMNYIKSAKEWDPSNTSYASHYHKLERLVRQKTFIPVYRTGI